MELHKPLQNHTMSSHFSSSVGQMHHRVTKTSMQKKRVRTVTVKNMSAICPTVTHLLLELLKAMTTIHSCCAFIQQCTGSTQQYSGSTKSLRNTKSTVFCGILVVCAATNSRTKLHRHWRQILASFQLCLKLFSLGFCVQWSSKVCNAPLGLSQTIKNGLRICRIWSHIWSTLGS